MNSDLRQQILVSLRAEGVGEADKAREALARIEEAMRNASKEFGNGVMTAEDFRKTIGQLGTSWNFFNQLLKESESQIEAVDVGLHKLQMTAVKFGDDYRASMAKAAQASEDLALKEAEALAKVAVQHEQYLEREAAAEAAAAIKKDELLAREIAAEIAAASRIAAAREQSATAGMVSLQQVQIAGLNFQEQQRQANLKIAQGKDGIDASAEASKKFGYAVLYAAHGLQDLQYGFAALLNNIPLIVQSIGGGPGLAGTVMLAGVGLELLKPKLIEAGQAIAKFGRDILAVEDPAKKMTGTVAGLKEKLEALEEKPHKVSLDYFNIEQAQKKLTALEERLESFNSHVNDATPLQDKVAKEVNAIIGEFSGGTDDKSGTQNLLDIIEAAQRSRGDTRFGGEFLARTEGFEKWKQRSEMRAGIMDRRSRGEFLIGEESILNDLNKEIPGLEKALVENARNRIKVMIEDARAGRDSGIKGLLGEFGRSPDAFLKPGAGMSPVDREFGAMLEQARGVNIQAREEEDAAERRAESARQNNADIQKIRKKADAARAQEAKAAADQAAGLDAANVRANEEYNRLQAATARNEAKDDRSQATSQRKADAAQAKAEREMAAAAKQDARDQIENYKMGLAQDIYNAAGGQLNPQGAMAAAQRAMQNMRQGQNEQQAAWSAMFETIQNLEQEAARFQAGMMGVNHQVNMIRHAQRRNRAQRPGLLPFFGQ